MNAVLENAKTVLSELTELHEEGWCACQSSTLPARVQAALGDLIAALSSPPADDVREALALTIAKTFPGWSEDTSEPVHVGWSEALRLHAEQHNERVNEECIRQGRALADAILAAFEVRPRGMVTPPADDVREAMDGDVKGLMGRLWAAADNAGVSREAVEFEWPECHKPKCQGSHGLPDVAMSYMKRAIMAEIEAELRYRLTTRPDHAPDTYSPEQAAAFNLAILLSNHNVHDEGTFIRAAERIVEAYPELVPVLSGREVRPYGTVTDAEKDAAHAEFCGCALRDKCEYWHASGLAIEAARAASS